MTEAVAPETTEASPTKPARLSKAKHVRPSRHFQALASRVIGLRPTPNLAKAVGVASCFHGEGTSTVASNLAVALNSAVDGNVLIVEAVEPKQSLWKKQSGLGWFDLMFNGADLPDVIFPTDLPGLSILPCGTPPSKSMSVYNPAALSNTVQLLKEKFEFIIFDLPCANDLSGCMPVASVLDGVLMVFKSGRVNSSHATRVKQEFEMHGGNVIGAVLNQTESHIPVFLRRWLGSHS